MNDVPVVQGRGPRTTPARSSVDRKVEGLHPQTDLGDQGALHRMQAEARGPMVPLSPGCPGGRHTWELPWGGHFPGGVILAGHHREAPQTLGSEEVALNRAVPSAPLGNMRMLAGDIFSLYSPVEGYWHLEAGTARG